MFTLTFFWLLLFASCLTPGSSEVLMFMGISRRNLRSIKWEKRQVFAKTKNTLLTHQFQENSHSCHVDALLLNIKSTMLNCKDFVKSLFIYIIFTLWSTNTFNTRTTLSIKPEQAASLKGKRPERWKRFWSLSCSWIGLVAGHLQRTLSLLRALGRD